jgi:hypothetical protein
MTEKDSYMKKFMKFDWDAIAGVTAAVIAIILHLLHIIQEEVLITLSVVLLALLFIRDIRRENSTEKMERKLDFIGNNVRHIRTELSPTDAILIGPKHLRSESEAFSRRAKGDMVMFHVCLLMFRNQSLFDLLLKPAIENPLVTSIQFVLDNNQKDLWKNDVVPKLLDCKGKEKVKEPKWTTIHENISLIISDSSHSNKTECLLSFWGEPFMTKSTGRDVPRFIFHVQGHSELITHLVEIERNYRLKV